jgi:nitrate reductase beta subunit
MSRPRSQNAEFVYLPESKAQCYLPSCVTERNSMAIKKAAIFSIANIDNIRTQTEYECVGPLPS